MLRAVWKIKSRVSGRSDRSCCNNPRITSVNVTPASVISLGTGKVSQISRSFMFSDEGLFKNATNCFEIAGGLCDGSIPIF